MELKKDQEQTDRIKEKQIQEILSLDRDEIFKTPKKKKVSFLTRLKITLGYGKKG